MVGGSILTDIGFYFSHFHKSSIIRTFSISYSGLLSISVHYDFLSQIFHCTHSVIDCWKNTWKKIWKESWLRTIIIEKFTRSNCILLISTGQVVTKKSHFKMKVTWLLEWISVGIRKNNKFVYDEISVLVLVWKYLVSCVLKLHSQVIYMFGS